MPPGMARRETAQYALRSVIGCILRTTEAARKAYPGLPVVFSGGVASNAMLREACAGTDAVFAQPQFSTDNAMGVAILTARGWRDWMELQILRSRRSTPTSRGYLTGTLLGQGVRSGRLSNYKVYPSGHHYFTMKDAEGALRCVMFRSSAGRLRSNRRTDAGAGQWGGSRYFRATGVSALLWRILTPAGAGRPARAFEQLKAKLLAEGLFDRA